MYMLICNTILIANLVLFINSFWEISVFHVFREFVIDEICRYFLYENVCYANNIGSYM